MIDPFGHYVVEPVWDREEIICADLDMSLVPASRKKTMIGTGSMNDPHQPCEAELGLTRRCLEVIGPHGFGATVVTKSDLVLHDADLLAGINERAKAVVQVSLTVADDGLGRKLEPNWRSPSPAGRPSCAHPCRSPV